MYPDKFALSSMTWVSPSDEIEPLARRDKVDTPAWTECFQQLGSLVDESKKDG